MEGTIEPTAVAYPDRVACPQCAAMLPASPRYATWCDSCGWNVVSADSALRDVDRGPFRRRYDALVLRTAERMHRQLLTGEPNTGHRSADAILAVLSALVLLAFLAFVALIVWWTITGSGFWHWPAAVAGILVVVALLLSLRTRKDDSRVVDPQQAADLYALVASVAQGVGAPGVARIRVDGDDSAYVRLRPFHRRPELVIGLVLWTRLAWEERVALLGHELGHLRGRHMPTLVVTSTAQNLLLGVVRLLWPAGYDVSGVSELSTWRGSWGSAGGATGNQWLAAAFQRVMALPAVSLLYVMAAVEANTRQRREYAADLAAVDVAGSAATRNLLVDLLPARGWRSVVGAAIRRGEDPWATLSRLDPLPEREVERLRRASAATRFRVDASHPPTHLRISLVEGRPAQPAPHLVDARVRQSIDLELEPYRRSFTEDVEDALGSA